MFIRILFTVFIGLFFQLSIAQNKSDLTKITASDRAKEDCFGWATSIYGDYCIVGSPEKKASINNRSLPEVGGAYIFKKQKNNTWVQTQKLQPEVLKSYTVFGGSVSIYDKYIAIGSCGDNDTKGYNNTDFLNRMGAVYIYKLTNTGNYSKVQKITLGDRNRNDAFGCKVNLFKNKLVISARGKQVKGSYSTGAVYVYELMADSTWKNTDVIYPTQKNDRCFFGEEIAISDDFLLISEDYYGTERQNIVYSYKLSKSNKFVFSQSITATDTTDKHFGSSLGVLGNKFFIGACGNFKYHDGDEKTENDTAIINYRDKKLLGSGSVYVFENNNNNNCVFNQRIIPKDMKADMHFGNALSVTDSVLIIGAFGDKLNTKNIRNNTYAGAAYVFKQKEGLYAEIKKITANPRSVWDKFAFSVSAYKNTIIIGSRFEKENAKEQVPLEAAGAAYIIEVK